MSKLPDAARMLEAAEQAALMDDLALADELLRRAAHIQEVELGPLDPDLASTLNNLAIVAEKTGRIDEAEMFYRRAVAITSASLAADHPMITASRENLEAFCLARGLSIDKPTQLQTVEEGLTTEAAPQSSIAPLPVPEQRTPSTSEPLPPTSRRVSRSLAWTRDRCPRCCDRHAPSYETTDIVSRNADHGTDDGTHKPAAGRRA